MPTQDMNAIDAKTLARVHQNLLLGFLSSQLCSTSLLNEVLLQGLLHLFAC
jgi:hypothetical protein